MGITSSRSSRSSRSSFSSRYSINSYKNYIKENKDFVCIINKKGYCVSINDTFSEKLGYKDTKKEIYNTKFTDFIHVDDVDNFDINGKYNYRSFKNRCISKNKEVILLEWIVIKINKKRLLCIIKEIDDVSGLIFKNLLNDSEKLCISGSWIWDINNTKLIWTDGLKRIYDIQNPTCESYMSKNHPDDRPLIEKAINTCICNKETYEFTHRIIVNEEIKYLLVKGQYMIKDNIPFIIGVCQDITRQYLIERSLRDAKEKADKASEMKSAFVANISHDIRTPINGIMGMVSLLKDYNLTNEQKECLDIISYSSGLLLSIINNVLDFSKIEAGVISMDFNNIYLKEFLSNIIISFKSLLPKNVTLNMHIDSKVPSSIISDRFKLRQIITNLISNSVKFTTLGSINIIVTLKNADIYFEVKDTGIGINNDVINNLFQPFIQADTTTTRVYGGAGLGLTICKKLVNLLKGKILLKSSVGLGTSIIFNIKNENNINIDNNTDNTNDIIENNISIEMLNARDDIEAIIDSTNGNYDDIIDKSGLNKRIIVVEDNKINQIIIKKSLEKLSYINYMLYKNGKELVNDIEILGNVSIILMDLHMPLLDGYDTTRFLRKNHIKCPIIALTANSLNGEKEKCIRIGMDDFLLKPVELTDLSEMIRKWLR